MLGFFFLRIAWRINHSYSSLNGNEINYRGQQSRLVFGFLLLRLRRINDKKKKGKKHSRFFSLSSFFKPFSFIETFQTFEPNRMSVSNELCLFYLTIYQTWSSRATIIMMNTHSHCTIIVRFKDKLFNIYIYKIFNFERKTKPVSSLKMMYLHFLSLSIYRCSCLTVCILSDCNDSGWLHEHIEESYFSSFFSFLSYYFDCCWCTVKKNTREHKEKKEISRIY
jgi:hypothetical protein